MPELQGTGKLKSFWEKPEGKTGMLFSAGGIIGVLLIMMKWGAALVTAAQNTLTLGIYVLIACGLGYVLLDPKFRAMIGFMYKSAMRFITGAFVQIDPIGILKNYVDDLKNSFEHMGNQISKLRGSIRMLQTRISENEKEMRDNMELAAQAKKTGKQNIMTLKTRKAGRLQESSKSYKDLLVKMEVIYRVLTKMHDNCGILIEDTEDQVKQKETEWKTIKQAHGAMQSAMKVIFGDKDKRAMYEQSLEFLASDLSNKIGEMERFMEMSESFMDSVDLQNGVFEERGFKMLEEWEKNADSILLGSGEKAQIISDANDDNKVLDVDAPVEEKKRKVQLESLFN